MFTCVECTLVCGVHIYVWMHMDVGACVDVRGQMLKGSSLPPPWVPRTGHKFQAASISVCCATSPTLTLIVGPVQHQNQQCACVATHRTFNVFSAHFKKCGRNSELTGHSWKEATRSLGEGLLVPNLLL